MGSTVHHAPSDFYISGLDSLRAYAVIIVAISHWIPTGFSYNIGHAGVSLFFVLSGFVNGLSWRRSGEGNYFGFIWRRIARIWPAYFLTVSLSVLFFFDMYEVSPVWNILFLSDVASTMHRTPLFPAHLWSLGVEQQFYFIFPLVAALAWKVKSKCAALIILLSWIFVRLLLGYFSDENIQLIRYSIASSMDLFLAGLFASKLLFVNDRPSMIFASVSGVIGFFLVASCFMGWRFSVLYAANTGVALISIFLIYSLVNGSRVLSAVTDYKYLMYVGKISYGFYLYHFLIGIALYPVLQNHGVLAYFICSFALTLIASSISFHFFESPAKDYLVSAYKNVTNKVRVT
ncbi:hypothetical protein C4K14_2187 [Pseudomonas chlororaphis subsp. aureofaciens]|uniref:acyltransferase family protein n=1 Tax=Pseudomonas chlororaphis TaxID=587753 RepID=UPI000F6B888C|nr:acyltransferase [Pseudomonas chlororaphis]AZD85021.1 hypothetical protein C4K14_2187 [Pseudomonas chlororaphis subsp. aureofaciens]